jgi:hypothetical protein
MRNCWRTTVTSVLLGLLAVTSCARTPTGRDLTGRWASNATVTQRGSTSETLCFANDGSIEWISQTPARTSRHRGTYKIVGNVLTMQSPDIETAATLRASLRLGKLELTSPGGSTQKYTKVSGSCDDNGR